MGIRIDADILNDINLAKEYQWLERTRDGAYAASTIAGMNITRSHGLFVTPYGVDNEKIVVLSKFEESVFINNSLHEISVNHYTDTIFPQGYKYLKRFEQNPFPKFIYHIEDRIIHKTLFMSEAENILVVRYELKNQGDPVKMVMKPFLAGRPNNELIKENQGLNTDSYLGQHWVRWAPMPDRPELYIYFTRGEFVPATLWYHNFYYPADNKDTAKETEDLFNPGFFQLQLRPYQTVDLFISTKELDINRLDYEALYRREAATRFYPRKGNKEQHTFLDLKANYLKTLPEEKDAALLISSLHNESSLRDLLFIMPSLLISDEGKKQFFSMFNNILKSLEAGLLPCEYPVTRKPLFCAADLSLWLFQLWHEYVLHNEQENLISGEIFETLHAVTDAYSKGTTNNIYADKDGLLYSGNSNINTSWISLLDKDGKVLRFGKLFEMNALWYNALKIMEEFSLRLSKKRWANKYNKMAQKAAASFQELFYNPDENEYYDFVNHNGKNSDFRINQIIPLSLSFSILDNEASLKLLSKIEQKLVTPFGLKSKAQSVELNGKVISRKNAEYYNGAIWPWSIQLYIRACLNYKLNVDHLANDLKEYFHPILRLVSQGLLGYIPEAVKMNEVVHQHGMEDFTPSLAAFIWMEETLSELSS